MVLELLADGVALVLDLGGVKLCVSEDRVGARVRLDTPRGDLPRVCIERLGVPVEDCVGVGFSAELRLAEIKALEQIGPVVRRLWLHCGRAGR